MSTTNNTRMSYGAPFGGLGHGSASTPTEPKPKPTSHQIELLKKIAELFNNAEFSDATILIRNVKLHAHQFILCAQCEYFRKAFSSSGFIESSTKAIQFNDGSGAAYWRLMEYLYTGEYSNQLSTTGLDEDSTLLRDVRVHGLADMFDIPDLLSLSSAKFQQEVAKSLPSDMFQACVHELYVSTYEGSHELRSAIVEAAIAQRKDPGVGETIKVLLREGGDFAVDYLAALEKRLR